MKKLLFALVGLVLFLVSTFFLWLQFPTLEDPDYVEDSLARSKARLAMLQAQAENPEDNGYYTSGLMVYWGGAGDSKPGNSFEQLVNDCLPYSSTFAGEKIQHTELQQSKDPTYLKALSNFEAQLPLLQSVLEKPALLNPELRNWEDTFATDVRLYDLSLALTAVAEAHLAQHEYTEALNTLKLCWRIGSLRSEQNHGLAMSLAIQDLAKEVLINSISPKASVPEQFWLDLARTLQESSPGPEVSKRFLEDEIFYLIAELQNSSSTSPGLLEPAQRARQVRLTKNGGTELLKSLHADGTLTAPAWIKTMTPWDEIKGRGSSAIVSNYSDWELNLELLSEHRSQMAGLATCAGIFAYRARHGKLPASLEELRALGLEPDPTIEMRYEPPKLFLSTRKPPPPRTLELESQTWMKVTPHGLEFQLTGAGE